MLTDSTRKYLCRIVGLYDEKKNKKKTIMYFATHLCLIPENVYGACKKEREMDWKLVASDFTVTSTDIFCSVPSCQIFKIKGFTFSNSSIFINASLHKWGQLVLQPQEGINLLEGPNSIFFLKSELFF